MVMKRFYSELGKLLYAIASVDKEISAEEKQKVLERVKNDLLPQERHSDVYGENVVSYLMAEFDFLDEQIADPQASYDSFIEYVKEHQSAITPELKKIILESARKVALSGLGTREEERKLFNRLRAFLATIRPLKRPRTKISPVRIMVEKKKKLKLKSPSKSM